MSMHAAMTRTVIYLQPSRKIRRDNYLICLLLEEKKEKKGREIALRKSSYELDLIQRDANRKSGVVRCLRAFSRTEFSRGNKHISEHDDRTDSFTCNMHIFTLSRSNLGTGVAFISKL